MKRYTSGAQSWTRAITKPVAGTVRVALDGAEQLGGWSIDATTGVVTFDTAVSDWRDPRQLPQVIQGAHPEPANLSCLEWMLGEHATVPPDRGIFLPVTRRMHPEVCRFISEQVYEGRLTSHPDTARQAVTGTRFPQAGSFLVPVEHEGNAQVAREEVEAIAQAARDLLAGHWTDKEASTRRMRETDIIVVAPYNAQVNALRKALPEGIRLGTVDKFQGQEAPVCLVSLTASSAEEITRGLEFLYSTNRINVAISRAKALALVFASPCLREAKCEIRGSYGEVSGAHVSEATTLTAEAGSRAR